MTTRLLLVRHGETDATASDRFSGDVNVILSPAGRHQVALLSRRLASEDIAAIYTSPLDRARETASALAEPRGLSPIIAEGLREIRHGHWEGLTSAEVKSGYPQEFATWEADPFTFAPEGGETGISVMARALRELRDIVTQHPDQQVIVVSHKGALRLAISSLLGIDPRLYRERLDLAPASLSIMDFQDAVHAQLVRYNDVSHYSSPPQRS